MNQEVGSGIKVVSSLEMNKAVAQVMGFHHKYKFEFFSKGKPTWVDDFVNSVPVVGLNKYLDATLKTGLASPAWYIGLLGPLVSDGSITSGQGVLTSASNPFTSAMQGKQIIVKGAGTAGADLVTMVASYTSAGQVTLAANAVTTVNNAVIGIEGLSADTMASHSFVEATNYSSASRLAWTPGAIASGAVDNSAAAATFVFTSATNITGAFIVDNATKGGTAGTLLGVGLNSPVRHVEATDSLVVTVQLVAVSV